jgi:transcriptional regulator with XRE-family HTH domain
MQDDQITQRCQDTIKAIKSLREERGLSTYQLSELTGLKQPHISRLEQGKYMPNLRTMQVILQALDAKILIEKKV